MAHNIFDLSSVLKNDRPHVVKCLDFKSYINQDIKHDPMSQKKICLYFKSHQRWLKWNPASVIMFAYKRNLVCFQLHSDAASFSKIALYFQEEAFSKISLWGFFLFVFCVFFQNRWNRKTDFYPGALNPQDFCGKKKDWRILMPVSVTALTIKRQRTMQHLLWTCTQQRLGGGSAVDPDEVSLRVAFM